MSKIENPLKKKKKQNSSWLLKRRNKDIRNQQNKESRHIILSSDISKLVQKSTKNYCNKLQQQTMRKRKNLIFGVAKLWYLKYLPFNKIMRPTEKKEKSGVLSPGNLGRSLELSGSQSPYPDNWKGGKDPRFLPAPQSLWSFTIPNCA